MFSLRNKENYLWIILDTPSYLELWYKLNIVERAMKLPVINRVATVREKCLENEIFSRSGKN